MTPERIRAAAERLRICHGHSAGDPDIYAVASALLAALPAVEALKAYEHECDNPVPDYMHRRHLREHLFKTSAAFDRAVEEIKP